MKRLLSLCILSMCLFTVPSWAMDWKPISPEDLALKKARVDPAADAEALFWEITVADAASNNQYPYTMYTHYLRIKIFTDRGVKEFGTVDLDYAGKEHISDLAARTIEPDGSIQELQKDAVFDRVVVKGHGLKVHARSFAMPGVKPGAIIEYRWRESHDNELANYVRLPGQRDIPIEHLVYHLKPLENPYFPYRMRYQTFNIDLPPFKAEPGGYFTSTVNNIPAYREEPDSPPADQVRSWVLIYYEQDKKETPDKFWKSEGKRLYGYYKPFIKVNGDVKALAAQITAGAKSPAEQLRFIEIYCQKNIKDLNGNAVTEADRELAKENHNTADTLKRGIGTPMDIQLAFAALAMASGFEARVACLPDRGSMFFEKTMMSTYYLPVRDIAVKVDGHWRLYDPMSRYIEPGRTRWQEEGVDALITDDKNPEWVNNPMTAPLSSQHQRAAKLRLGEDGSLEGDVTEILTGHPAEIWRWQNRDRSVQDREEQLRTDARDRLPGAEVTQIKLSDPADLAQTVSLAYHIKVQGYATRTGKRLFVTPAFFEFNEAARYSSGDRRYDICWDYPWSEIENVSIQVPDGFSLDHADAPGSLIFDPVGSYTVNISKTSDNHVLYHRELIVGQSGNILVPRTSYPNLKKLFDGIHDRDSHLLTLKMQTTTVAGAK